MLSILIPTYNFNCYTLAVQIVQQAVIENIVFELICIDDGSLSLVNKENQKINCLANCKFIELKKNIGLSNNRNALVKESKYENIIFLDGDSLLPDKKYINRYLKALKKNTDVIYGGRIHPEMVDSTRKLRWKYGTKREDLKAAFREKNKFKCILFNNTLIKRTLFNKIGFDKALTQYGHEDTLFAYNISKLNVDVLHIDNPVLHNDIDNNAVYLNKTIMSLENLNSLYKSGSIDPHFVTFLRHFNRLKLLKLNYLFAFNFKVFHTLYESQLTSINPSIFIFDIFRLSYFCKINLKK